MPESWSISRRLGAGFLLITLIVVGLALFAQRAVGSLGQGYTEYREISRQTVAIATYMEDMYEARLAALRYRAATNDADLRDVLTNLDEILTDTTLIATFTINPSRAQEVGAIRETVADYRREFVLMSDNLVKATAARDAFNAQADVLVDQINEVFSRTVQTSTAAAVSAAGRSLQSALTAMVTARQYFATDDPAQLAQAQEQFIAFDRALRQLDALNQQDSVASLITQAATSFQGLPDLLADYGQFSTAAREIAQTRLDLIGADVEQRFDLLAENIITRQQSLGPEGEAIVERLLLVIPGVGALATILSVLAAILIGRGINHSLTRLAETTDQLAAGNNGAEINGTEYKHELGRMARALNIFKQAQIEREQASAERARLREEQNSVVHAMKDHLAALAKGDLAKEITTPFAEDYEELRINYNLAIKSLQSAIAEVSEAAGKIGAITDATTAATHDLSQRTENQAATLEQTAAALDELTASVKSAAEHAKSVDTSVRRARAGATKNGEIVAQAVSAMEQIAQSSNEISRVISMIDDIAFQTNLLALNAGVEAARAGESGKGFAVVASEVRALAQRSAEAAKEIAGLIANSSRHVQQGTELVGNAGDALDEIITQVNDIAEMTNQIATSAEEQATGLTEINIGVNQLDQVTQQNAAMVQESLTRGDTLATETAGLRRLIGRFQLGRAASGAASPQPAVDRLSAAIANTSARPSSVHAPKVANGASHWEEF